MHPRTRTIHDSAVVADAHNDLLCLVAARPSSEWSAYFRRAWLPRLQAGAVDIQVLPVFIDGTYRPEGVARQTMRMIEAAHVVAEGSADEVALCVDGADVDRALASGRIALVLALESAPLIDEDVELVSTLFRMGVRIASIAHFGRTQLADGSGEDATGSRLTSAGVRVLAEMQRLGMIFDVSHLNVAGVEHVAELATRPVIATHSSARALREHHRNLSDEQLRSITGTGGMVCVNFFAPFLHETDFRIGRLVDHIEHIASVVGIDRVGLGSDFMIDYINDLAPRWCEETVMVGVNLHHHIEGLTGPDGLPLVTEALIDRGWVEADIRKVLGGNVLDLFRTELGVAATDKRAAVPAVSAATAEEVLA